jgi:hypothetical protein
MVTAHTFHVPLTRWGGSDRAGARARLKRRAFPIHSYHGPNGTGKSAIMMYDTIPSLDCGRRVLSTVRILDFRDPHLCGEREYDVCDDPANHELIPAADFELLVDLRFEAAGSGARRRRTLPPLPPRWHAAAHPLYVRFEGYEQLMSWRDGDVLLDEVAGVASSRDAMTGMPTQVANLLMQLRRRNIALRWTSPAWARADKIIREVTQAVTLMAGFAPVGAPPAHDGSPTLWSRKRLFEARTFDASMIEEFTARRTLDVRPDIKAWYWAPGSLMFSAYDTLDPVVALGWANSAGLCIGCGGKRTIRKCDCPDEAAAMAPAPAAFRMPEGARELVMLP